MKRVEENIYGVVRCGVVRGSGCEVWYGERVRGCEGVVIVRSVVRCSVVRGICSSVNVVRGVVVLLALWPEEWLCL